jgi:hypothetical protein
MKAILFNLTAAVLIATTGIMFTRYETHSKRFEKSWENAKSWAMESSDEGMLVPAIVENNEIIPVVQLPELIIEDTYNQATMVRAIQTKDEVLPVVELPELIIEG